MRPLEVVGELVAEFMDMGEQARTSEEKILLVRLGNAVSCMSFVLLALYLAKSDLVSEPGPVRSVGLLGMLVSGLIFGFGAVSAKTLSLGGLFFTAGAVVLLGALLSACLL